MATKDPLEPFYRLTVAEAKAMIDNGAVQVIDVRNPDEYAEGHVPNAVLIPVDKLYERTHELSPEKALLFICAAGIRSALACEIAAAAGYERLYNIEGGTGEWISAGYEVEK